MSGNDQIEFIWNSRRCKGGPLHLAALQGNLEAARAAIDSSVTSRFTYETFFAGRSQEGSGEAIHLAASRGHVEVAKLLLSQRADLNSMVSRDHKPHYDVLHAAMFAEGRGGSFEMIEYLFEARAEMTRNQDGKYPLHIAFLTGNVPVINLLRRFMAEKNVSDSQYKDPSVPLPLEMGIRGGKMSEMQLSEAAELSTLSLTTFIDACPQCIPTFLQRMDEKVHVSPKELARNLTRLDIAQVLRESPEAVIALLDHATDEPECENVGWHPLPTRVSFAPTNLFEKVREVFNPPQKYLTNYEVDHSWRFDSHRFVSPAWHQRLCDRTYGRPIVDADIRVCHIPDLLCAEVFSALCDPINDEANDLFVDDTIHAMIKHIFWSGCCRLDLISVLLTFWGLAVLVFEEFWVQSLLEDSAVDARSLRHEPVLGLGGPGLHSGGTWMVPLDMSGSEMDSWVAICWVASKGLVDVYLEYTRFRGYMKIGRWQDYFCWSSFTSLLFAALPSLLFFRHASKPIMICAVFIYWGRLLDCFTSAQYIGTELLPIAQLSGGLGPSLFATAIAFGAFCHAFFLARHSNQALWPVVGIDAFAVLITAGLPKSATAVSNLELLLILIAVLFFSVIVMNIFIGVICEQYIVAKENVQTQFRKLRAQSCLCYLLRSRVIPCSIVSASMANLLMVLVGIVALGTQIYCFVHRAYKPWVSIVFFCCQFAIVTLAFQSPQSPWVKNSHESEKDHYIWFCKRKVVEEEEPLAKNIHSLLNEMSSVMAEIKALEGDGGDT